MKRDALRHPSPHSQGVQKLMDDTGGRAKVRVDKKTGEAKFVQLPANSLPWSMITNKAAKAEERAKAFVREYGNAFGADKPDADLTVVKSERDAMGFGGPLSPGTIRPTGADRARRQSPQ